MTEMNQNQNPQDPEEESIDWAKYIGLLLQNWKKIFIISCIFGVIGIVAALLQKRVYTVSITLAPEVQNPSRSGSLGNLASMFGINMSGASTSADALNITIFPEIVGSTPFLTQLFEVELSPKPVLPADDPIEARRIMQGPLPTVKLYDHLTGRDKEKGWLRKLKESIFGEKEEDPDYMKANVSILTREQNIVVERMRKFITADVDKKTAMTTITVSLDDPMMCSQLADTVCLRLREFVFKYRTEKEQKSFDYYSALCDSAYQKMTEAQATYAAAVDNNHNVILQTVAVRRERLQQEASLASQVYQQMVQQREISRARLQEMKPVFAVVEPGTYPQRPANSRVKTVLMFGFFGFFLSAFWYLIGKEYYMKYFPMVKDMLKKKN